MNYLAHLHLAEVAGENDEGRLGNLVADMVKGPEVELLPAGVQAGIRMHRGIDRFTDTHPLVQRSIGRISAEWGWFSGIVIDVFYDHILAANWLEWSDEPLPAFVERTHAMLLRGTHHLNADGQFLVSKLIETNRLLMYAAPDGIADTLARLSDRIAIRLPQRARRLEEAMPLLEACRSGLEADFRGFYPAVVEHAVSFRGSRRESVPDSCAKACR